jgi:fructokinase
MIEKQFKIVGLGEVLFDVLPTGKQLGGAPANFAYISNRLGNYGIVASRVGNDENGREILTGLANKGVDISHVQIDENHPTGTVEVELKNGQPSYKITENIAWDFLEMTQDWRELATSCDAVCFGSLAQRNAASQKTVYEFLALTGNSAKLIFDVNLRQAYFSKDILLASLNIAKIVKLNHEELPIVAEMFNIICTDEIETAKSLLKQFNLDLICVTRGSKGSLLLDENRISENSGIKIEVADTIGAGDAFTATMTHGVLHGWDLDKINLEANRVAALVASQSGAMPEFSPEKP